MTDAQVVSKARLSSKAGTVVTSDVVSHLEYC